MPPAAGGVPGGDHGVRVAAACPGGGAFGDFPGLEEGFKFAPGSEYTATDLFQNFKDMMPGDSRTEVILFRNEAKDCDYVNLYLRAVAHDPEGNPLSPALTEAGETEKSANAFLAELTLEIRIGENLVYRGPANAGWRRRSAWGPSAGESPRRSRWACPCPRSWATSMPGG